MFSTNLNRINSKTKDGITKPKLGMSRVQEMLKPKYDRTLRVPVLLNDDSSLEICAL